MPQWNPFYKEKKNEALSDTLAKHIAELPAPTLALYAASFGVLATWGTTFAYRRYFRRIPNVDWITPDVYKRKQWIKGRVVRCVILRSCWWMA